MKNNTSVTVTYLANGGNRLFINKNGKFSFVDAVADSVSTKPLKCGISAITFTEEGKTETTTIKGSLVNAPRSAYEVGATLVAMSNGVKVVIKSKGLTDASIGSKSKKGGIVANTTRDVALGDLESQFLPEAWAAAIATAADADCDCEDGEDED